jgi:hypothetical protein
MHGIPDAAEKPGAGFRRWLSARRLPLISTLAASVLFGAAALSLPEAHHGGGSPALQGNGGAGKRRLTLEEKISAWQNDLGFSRGCNPAKFRGILAEIQDEEARLMESEDTKGLMRLFEVERAASEIYWSDVRDPSCAKGGRKRE